MASETESTGNPIVDAFEGLRELALNQWEITLFLFLFATFRWWWGGMVDKEESLSALLTMLRHNQAGNAYKLLLSWLLDSTDRWFLSREQYQLRLQNRPAWSVKLYDRTLLLAVLYPLLSLYLYWAITNRHGTLGDLTVIGGGVSLPLRASILIGLGAILFASARTMLSVELRSKLIWLGIGVASGVAVAVAIAIAVWSAITFVGAIAVAGTIAVAVAVAVTGARVGVGAIAVAVAVTVAVAVGRAEAIPAAGDWLLGATRRVSEALFARRFSEEIFVTVWIVWQLTVALVVAFVTAVGLKLLLQRTGTGSRTYVTLTFLLAGSALLAENQGWTLGAYLLFLAVLPLVNAIFDFGSIGLTRWALRRGLQHIGFRTLGFSLIDLNAAVLLFLALGCAAIVVIHLMNLSGIGGLVLLSGGVAITQEHCQELSMHANLFQAVRTCPADYWWLYATFFSTLAPTVMHLIIAVWSIGPAVLGRKTRHWIARQIETSEQSFHVREPTLAILSAWSAFAVAAPVIILIWIGGWVAEFHPEWGLLLLDFFEGFYRFISGAVAL
ncbi:MAG: hypothetical protein AAF674_03820 [Pseudomonadota bacterium]